MPGDSRFERLSVPLQADLYRAARALTSSDADALDLLQDTYLKALRAFPSYREEQHFKAWMFTILRHVHVDRCRRRRLEPGLIEPDAGPLVEAPEPRADALPEEVGAALSRLRPSHHVLLLLREVQGFSYREIAEILGIPPGSVMSGLHHARHALRVELARPR